MIDQEPRKTRRQPNHKQLPQLTRLNLEQLEKVAGGPTNDPPDTPPVRKLGLHVM